MKEDKKRGIGLRFALNGLKEAFVHERNFRIHIVAAIIVIVAAVYFQLTATEWLFILFAIQVVIVTELTNTVIERIIDYVKPDIHPQAKAIKDIAASIVLIGAIFAVIIGLIIFLPKIISL